MESWFAAVFTNNKEDLQQLASKYINQVDENGDTALIIAARRGYDELFEILGKEIKQQNLNQKSALMEAAIAGHLHCISGLIGEIGLQDQQGWSACMHAAANGHTEIFSKLLPFEWQLRDDSGASILMSIVLFDQLEMVRLAVQTQPKLLCAKDSFGKTALMRAVTSGFSSERTRQYVEILIQEKDIIDSSGLTAYRYAQMCGVLQDILQILIVNENAVEDDEDKEYATLKKRLEQQKEQLAQDGGPVDLNCTQE